MIEKIEDLKCCVQKDIINYNKLRNNKNKSIKQIKAKKQVRMINKKNGIIGEKELKMLEQKSLKIIDQQKKKENLGKIK